MSIFAALKMAGKALEGAAPAAEHPFHEMLMVSHAISPTRVKGAAASFDLNLPSPSLGVHKVTNPNENFGEILLVGKPAVLDEPGVSTYGADVYSRTVPEPYVTPTEGKPALVRNRLVTKEVEDEHFGKYTLQDREVLEQDYTPENIVDYMNSVDDRNTEGVMLDGKGLNTVPNTFVGLLASVTPELQGTAGASARRQLFSGGKDEQFEITKRSFQRLGNEYGYQTVTRAATEATKYDDVDAFEAALRATLDPADPDPRLLHMLDKGVEDVYFLGKRAQQVPTEYGEVRPHKVIEVRKDGKLDIAFVPEAYPGQEDLMFEAVKELRARGVEVHRVPAKLATPAYKEAFAKVVKEARLQERGYTFGVGGAAVMGVANLTEGSGEAQASTQETPEPQSQANTQPQSFELSDEGFAALRSKYERPEDAELASQYDYKPSQLNWRSMRGNPVPYKTSNDFREEAGNVAERLGVDTKHLLAVMNFESGGTFSPSVKNPGSSATGLIQFMDSTARGLGTTTGKLAQMTAVEQLRYVEKYLAPYRGKLKTLGDAYMAVLWPKAVGKPDSFVLWKKGDKAFLPNAGLDFDKDGVITKGEAVAKVAKRIPADEK